MMRSTLLPTGLLTLLWGCQTMAIDNDVPALIVDPDEDSFAALQEVIDNALKTPVRLAGDALTKTSLLAIERSPPHSMQAPPAQGRVLEKPLTFRLVRNGSDCVLIDGRDDTRHVLKNTRCVAE